MNLYRWPIIGPILKINAQAEGETIASQLYGRGVEPARIVKYANKEAVCAVYDHDTARYHLFTGMARYARTLERNHEP